MDSPDDSLLAASLPAAPFRQGIRQGICQLEFLDFRKQIAVLGDPLIPNFAETDGSLFVDQKTGALGESLLVKDAKLLRDLSMREEIGQHGKANAAELLGEDLVTEGTVTTNTHDLSIEFLEAFQVSFEVLQLVLSPRGEGQGIEGNENILLAAVLSERVVFAKLDR